MEDLYKAVKLDNGIKLPIYLNKFNHLHIKKHEVKSVIGFHYNNHDYTIYKDYGFIGEERRIPRSQFYDNIIKVLPRWIEQDRLNDSGLVNKVKELSNLYNVENPILCYSSIVIKNYGLQQELLATEYDEIMVSGRFSYESMDIQKYKISYETLCELIRNP